MGIRTTAHDTSTIGYARPASIFLAMILEANERKRQSEEGTISPIEAVVSRELVLVIGDYAMIAGDHPIQDDNR